MLAVATLRHTKDEGHGDMNAFSIPVHEDFPDFSVFSDGNLLDSIDFDDLFVGINIDGEELPDLEMDPGLLASFSISTGGEGSDMNMSGGIFEDATRKEDEDSGSGSSEESVSKGEEFAVAAKTAVSNKDGSHEKGRKTSSSVKNSHHGKRKVKVDWTPELHRRFVQAVEQLGVDKAVPSRILEIMGIDCLTRHNIASHLQKYRSHRKHLQAREAEAASWSQRRQMYNVAASGGGGGGKREMNPWLALTMGFPPPMTPPPPPPMHPHFRPLHVWGHPSVDQSHMNLWPKHLPHSPPPPQPSWAPPRHPPSSHDPSYWHPHHQRVPNGLIQGAHCFPTSPLATTRFGTPHVPVQGIPPHAMYKLDSGCRLGSAGQSGGSHLLLDLQPSKESIDAAIGDVILKPWLPLPLGLKPPSLDGVLVELQRQGVPKIPPTAIA